MQLMNGETWAPAYVIDRAKSGRGSEAILECVH
jgi:hypothetical protein